MGVRTAERITTLDEESMSAAKESQGLSAAEHWRNTTSPPPSPSMPPRNGNSWLRTTLTGPSWPWCLTHHARTSSWHLLKTVCDPPRVAPNLAQKGCGGGSELDTAGEATGAWAGYSPECRLPMPPKDFTTPFVRLGNGLPCSIQFL